MSDATYDAVIIGGGNKGLNLAMYLVKYGGMDVAIFERKHEAGGSWCSDEGVAPGFIADYHASGVGALYQVPTERDFPEWKEFGGGYNEVKIGGGAIFKEDDSCIVTYNRVADPSGERTAESIARFSQKDAEAWGGDRIRKMKRSFLNALIEWIHTPPPLPGEPDALEKLLNDPKSGFDPAWAVKSPIDVAREVFENDAVISMVLRNCMSWGFFPDIPAMGFLPVFFMLVAAAPRTAGAIGGTHNWAHAAVKVILSNGGKIFTEHEVNNLIIENGTARGVRLINGTEVNARKLVVSTLDPYTLCFRLIGKDYLNSQILRKVENLERRYICITWYTWGLHEPPNYKAADFNQDINEVALLVMVSKDPESLVREQVLRRLGKMPHGDDLHPQFINYSLVDKRRVPEGKSAVLTEQFVLPANALSEAEWLKFKRSHAEELMEIWQKHSTNMSWENVIGYVPITPYDICGLPNMAPTGNWAVIDHTPSQLGRFRPILELARHKTPIKNLYATGSAWHPWGAASCWQSYNCYKVIADDLGLAKPWESHPW